MGFAHLEQEDPPEGYGVCRCFEGEHPHHSWLSQATAYACNTAFERNVLIAKLKIKNKIKIVIETIALVIILEYTAFICFVL